MDKMKRVISLILSLIICIGTFPAAVLASGSSAVLLDQSFAGLTQMPSEWSVTGAEIKSDCISAVGLGGAIMATHNNKIDAQGDSYTFSITMSNDGGSLSYVTFGRSSAVTSDNIYELNDGYTITLRAADSPWGWAEIKLYKNGELLTTLEDKDPQWVFQSLRTYTVTVMPDKLIFSAANNSVEIEDNEPIYSGYTGMRIFNYTEGFGRLAKVSMFRLLDVEDAGVSDSQSVTDTINVKFNAALSEESVNYKNVYLTDINGNKLPESDYSVAAYGEYIKITPIVPLEYEKEYILCFENGISDSEKLTTLSHAPKYEFKTEKAPFSVKSSISGNNVNVKVYNSHFTAQNIYTFVYAMSGETVTDSKALAMQMPVNDEDEQNVGFTDLSGKTAGAFVLDTSFLPLLVNAVQKYDAQLPSVEVVGDNAVIAGIDPSGSARNVYIVIKALNEDIANDSNVRAVNVKSEDTGRYSATLSMSGFVPGYYTAIVSGDSFSAYKSVNFYFADSDSKNSAVREINKAASMEEDAGILHISKCLLDYSEVLSLNSTLVKLIKDNEYEQDVAKRLYSAIKQALVPEDAGVSMQTLFGNTALMIAAEKGHLDTVMSIIDFYAYDTANGTTAAYIYNNNLTESGQTAVKTAMTGTVYNTADDIYKSFAKAVVAASVMSWHEEGYDHITEVLGKNGAYIGLNMAGYNNIKDKKKLNEYIYNSGADTFAELKKAVNDAVLSCDESYYTYTFSTADSSSESDWTIDLGTYGELSDEYGVFIDPDKEKSGNATVISKFDISGNYQLSGDFRRDWNQLVYYFNYIDNKNYTYVRIRSSSETDQYAVIGRVVNGTDTQYGRVEDGSINGISVVVEQEGYVSVMNVRGEYAIPRTYVGSALEGGKIGMGLEATIGYIRTINVLTYLSADVNVNKTAASVENDKIGLTFNFPVKSETVNKDSVKFYENGKEITAFEITASDDMQNYEIALLEKLKYKSRYKLVLSDTIKAYTGSAKFIRDYTIEFITENPTVNILYFKGTNGGEDIFTNDISQPEEIYTSVKKLTDYKNKTIDLTLNAENKGTKSEDVFVVFELTDENGKALCSSTESVTLNAGLPTTVTSQITVPETVTDASVFNYFVFNSSEKLHTVYPYTVNKAIGDGELPIVSKKGDTLKISGSTISALADKNINIIITASDGTVIKTASLMTDSSGKYDISVDINADLITVSGDLSVYVSGEEFKKALVKNIYYAISNDRLTYIKDINKRSDTQTAVEQYKDEFDLSSDNSEGIAYYEKLNNSQKEQLALMLDKQKPFNETDNGASFTDTVLRYSVLLHYNSGNSELLFDNNGNFLSSDIIDFAIEEKSKSAYTIYAQNLTETGKKLVRDNLLNRGCGSVEELCKIFAQNVVAYGINHWTENGYGHINSLLVNQAANTGIDLTKYNAYNNKPAFEQSLINNPVSGFANLQERINTLTNPVVQRPSGGGGGGGSSYSAYSKNSLPVDITDGSLVVPAATPEPAISEEERYKWAKTAVDYLLMNNIAEGYDDGTFGYGRDITREEFVKLIVNAFKITESGEAVSFNDMQSGAWYEPFIKAAASQGIVKGYADGNFGIGTTITRQDAIVMLSRTLSYKGSDVTPSGHSISVFIDSTDVSGYAVDALNYFVEQGLIKGVGDNRLAPKSNCTRAEMAQMLYNVLNRKETAPAVTPYSYTREFNTANSDMNGYSLNEGYTVTDDGIQDDNMSNVLMYRDKEAEGKYEYSVQFKAPFENTVRLLFNYVDEQNHNYIEIQPYGSKASLKTVCEDKLYTGGLYDLGTGINGDEWIKATIISNGGRGVSLKIANDSGEFEVFTDKYLENGSQRGYVGFGAMNNPLAVKNISLNIFGSADYIVPEYNMPNDEGQIDTETDSIYDESVIELMCALGIMQKNKGENDPSGTVSRDELLNISKKLKTYYEPKEADATNADALNMIFNALHCMTDMNDEQRFTAAISMGLLENTRYSKTGKVTRHDLAQMIYNAFETEMLDREAGTFMSVILKLEKIKGQLTDSGITALSSPTEVGMGNIKIGDKVLSNKAGAGVEGMIGRMVEAYYSDESEALYVKLQKKEMYLAISYENFVSFANNTLRYVDEGTGKEESVSILPGAALIINGESVTNYTDSVFDDIEDGYITLIASDNSDYDTIVAESYRSFVVGSVLQNEAIIYNVAHSAGTDSNRQYILDLAKYQAIDIIDNKGNKAEISDISEYDVLSVAESDNYIKIYISKHIENNFNITFFENNGDENVLGNSEKKYVISSHYDEIRDKADLKVGKTYTLYINHFGKVAWAQTADIIMYETGVLADIFTDDIEEFAIVKVYETDGEIKRIPTERKIKFRNESGNEFSVTYAELVNLLKGKNEIISYKTNSEEKITQLELAYDGYIADCPNNLMKIADAEEGAYSYKMAAYAFGYKYFLTRVKRMFSVSSSDPTDLNQYSRIDNVWQISNADAPKMKLYSQDSSYLVDYAILYDHNDVTAPPEITSRELVVRSIVQTVNADDEVVYQINGNTDTTLYCDAEVMSDVYDMFGYDSKSGTKYTVDEGDIIKYRTDAVTGKIVDMILIYDDSAYHPVTGTRGWIAGADAEDVPFVVNRDYTILSSSGRTDGNRRYFYGWVYSNEDGVIEVTTQDLTSSGNYYMWNNPESTEYISECYTDELYKKVTISLDEQTGNILCSETNEIRPFNKYGTMCSRALICSSVHEDDYFMMILN